MEHSKQNIASLVVLKTPPSYEDSENNEDSEKKKKIINKVSSVEALVNLFQIREKAARDSEAMNCRITSEFFSFFNSRSKILSTVHGWQSIESCKEPFSCQFRFKSGNFFYA